MSNEYDEPSDLRDRYGHLKSLVGYQFNSRLFDFDTATEKTEDDETLAAELRRFYPELRNWSNKSLATAWRSYSQRVGLVTEEYVCVREPHFLAFLYVNQEGWPIAEEHWIEALDRAVAELWK